MHKPWQVQQRPRIPVWTQHSITAADNRFAVCQRHGWPGHTAEQRLLRHTHQSNDHRIVQQQLRGTFASSTDNSVSASSTSSSSVALEADIAPVAIKTRRRFKSLGNPHTPASSSADALAYLQKALDISASEAAVLASRVSRSDQTTTLLPVNCQGWVEHLLQLAEGSVPIARGILLLNPQFLLHTFNEARRDELERVWCLLSHELGIGGQDMLVMMRRHPPLLLSPASTIEASLRYLQTHLDPATLRVKLVQQPQALGSSVSALQEKLWWLIDVVGMPSGDALIVVMHLMTYSVVNTLDPHRQWLLARGFSAKDAARMVRRCPQILLLSLSELDRRLTFVSTICHGSPQATDVAFNAKDDARRLFVSQPTLLSCDFESDVMQLKLRFWQDGLGCSLRDLHLVPQFMLSSMERIVTRTHMLKHLLGETRISHARLKNILISGSGAIMLPPYVNQQLAANPIATSVADVLAPLAVKLNQCQLQQAWLDHLHSSPSNMSVSGTRTDGLCELYAKLCDAYLEDCRQSPAVREWLTAVAAAKEADGETRLAMRTTQAGHRAAAKAAKPQANRQDKGGTPVAAAEAAADGSALPTTTEANAAAAVSASSAVIDACTNGQGYRAQ